MLRKYQCVVVVLYSTRMACGTDYEACAGLFCQLGCVREKIGVKN